MTRMAKEYKVATQMGNQGNSGEGIRQMCEWIWDGAIGEISEVHAWTNRPIWPQGLHRPAKGEWPPDTLNWDLFIGPAKMKPYHSILHPWNWRGWWDYGTGALGDMACHILDPIFKALRLESPTRVQGSSTQFNTECAPTRGRKDIPLVSNSEEIMAVDACSRAPRAPSCAVFMEEIPTCSPNPGQHPTKNQSLTFRALKAILADMEWTG
jgi:predicted dehydrogenase